MFEKAKKFVDKIYKGQVDHLERTVFWIKELKPDADEALLIAGYAHDIQRKVNPVSEPKFVRGKQLDFHQQEGGRIMYEWLKENGATEEMAIRVRDLISKHEVGGTDDQNVLKDADSLSFFETKKEALQRLLDEGRDRDDVKSKLDWMFKRITSHKAKEIARPMYEKMLKALGF